MDHHALRVTARAGLATLAAALVAPVLAVPAAVAVLAFEMTRVARTLSRRVDEVAGDVAQTQALVALPAVLPTRHPLPALREYAIAPDCAVLLAELVADARPKLVLETGSGASTVILAYALERLGRGRVIALEHDPAHAARTRAELARHGVADFATVIDAPLERVRIGETTHTWYATRAIAELDGIDLVFDDGPPRCAGTMLRYASLPLLAPRLSPAGLFVLDAIGEEEREILARWRAELPELVHEELATRKGNVIIRRAAPVNRRSGCAPSDRPAP